MNEKTKAEYEAERERLLASLNQANLHVQSLATEKNSLEARNRRQRKTLEDVAALIRAQKAEEALPLIAVALE